MSDKCKLQVEIKIMNAIGLCGSEGASLDDIQKHLKSTLKNNVPDLESIQSVINDAVAKEFLLELDNGKYKIKGLSKPAEATSKGISVVRLLQEIMIAIARCGSEGASLDDIEQHLKSTLKNNVPDLESIQSEINNAVADEFLLELDNGKYKIIREDNEIKATRSAKENAKEVECFDGKVAQDANRNTDSDTKSIGTSIAEKDTNVSLPDDNDRVLPKLNKLHLKDNETKATGKCAEINVQEVKRPLDKGTQDANRNADSNTGNVGSSLTEEDAKVSLPDDYDEVVSKLNDLHHKDNETKATGRRAEENAQDVERSVDKATQDTDRNADSEKGRVFFSETEKDANIPLPDDDHKIDKEKLIKCLKKEK